MSMKIQEQESKAFIRVTRFYICFQNSELQRHRMDQKYFLYKRERYLESLKLAFANFLNIKTTIMFVKYM